MTALIALVVIANVAASCIYDRNNINSVNSFLEWTLTCLMIFGVLLVATFKFFDILSPTDEVTLNIKNVIFSCLSATLIYWALLTKRGRSPANDLSHTPSTHAGSGPQHPPAEAGVETIIKAYGVVLGASGTIVRNQSELPYSKEQIKTAIIAAIIITEDGDAREQLVLEYLSLGDFQELSDREDLAVRACDTTDMPEIVTTQQSIDLAKQMSKHGDVYKSVLERVTAERDALARELEEIGVRTDN